MATRSKRSLASAAQKAFLAAYARCGNISEAARAAQVQRKRHYEWLVEDPDYPDLFSAAHEEAVDALEREARKRAMHGSDVLLIFLLKGARPAQYRDNWKGEISGPGGGPVRVDLSNLTDEQLEMLETIAKAAARPRDDRSGEGPTGPQ